MFGIVLLSVVTLMHVYVFWRASTVPFVKRWFPGWALIGLAVLLWTGFWAGRVYARDGVGLSAMALELFGMSWMAVVFLTTLCLLVVELGTGFGFLWRRAAPALRGAALAAGGVLSTVALFQGLRAPDVRPHEVRLPGLPPELDGTVVVALSDLHLGSLIGGRWLQARVAQVEALDPDLVVLAGDVFEGHGLMDPEVLPAFRSLAAPLGVWAVPGNHDFHRDGGADMPLLRQAGHGVLRNAQVEVAPGLRLAGVDDLTRLSRRGEPALALEEALGGTPAGATVLLSHSPLQAETAAALGADLMISGHTHGGQIWPFGYLVRRQYPLFAGRYQVDGMTVLVGRGTGTWGPRMRLWQPGEILHVTLRAP